MAETSGVYSEILRTARELAGNKSEEVKFEERSSIADQQTLIVPKESYQKTMESLKKTFGFRFFLDLCGVDYPGRAIGRFDVVVHLLDDVSKNRLRVKCALGENDSLPSLVSVWGAANWFEREAYDMFGIQFVGHPDMRRILCHEEFEGFPLRKDYPADQGQPMTGAPLEHVFEKDKLRLTKKHDDDLMWINIGPAHPATHGTLRFMAVIDGAERIQEVDSEIGYLHRCFEKMCETHNYNQIIPYTDRLNYCSAPLNNNCFAQTVEKLLGVEVPKRAQVIRMILDELSRIIDHMVCIGTGAVDLGAMTGFFYMFNEREKVYQLFEKLCGARLTVSLTRIGGLGFDLPDGWVRDAREVVGRIERSHAEIHRLLTENRIYVQRTRGSGKISADDAVDLGFTGPCLRSTGYKLDLRKHDPYYLYDEVEFDVPVGSEGDSYDRYLCRMAEIWESCRILRQLLDDIPDGPIAVDDPRISLPPKKEVYGNIEGLMNHFMLVINGVQPPAGEIYHRVESPNGELGFYLVSDGSGLPYRVKCRPPCFPILAGFPKMTRGGRLADAIATLGTLNVIAGELDR